MRGMDRDRETFRLLIHFTCICNNQAWATLKPGVLNRIWVFPVMTSTQVLPPRVDVSRKLRCQANDETRPLQ